MGSNSTLTPTGFHDMMSAEQVAWQGAAHVKRVMCEGIAHSLLVIP